MRIILFVLGLLWSSGVFGQFVDTIEYTGQNQGFSWSSGGKVKHGDTEIKTYNKRQKRREIHRSTYEYTHSYSDEKTLELRTDLYSFDYEVFNLPDTFQTGTDSVFMQILEPLKSPYLYRVIQLYDKDGTAKITEYYPNGHTKFVINYIADTIGNDTSFNDRNYEVFERGETIFDDNGEAVDHIVWVDTAFVKEGFIHGLEVHYYDNGKLKYKGYTKYDYKDSIYTYYHKNGQIYQQGKFKNGKRDGKFMSWFEDGSIEGINYYDNDRPIGTWELWYKNGQRKSIGHYNKIGETGIWKEWTEEGQLIIQNEFKQPIVINESTRIPYPNTIKQKEWYDNGQLKKKENLTTPDIKNGQYIEYYENGQLKEKGRYASVIDIVLYKIFWQNKIRPLFMMFGIDDFENKNGKWKYYDKNGNLLLVQKYRFGQKIREKTYGNAYAIYDLFHPPAEEHCRKQLNMSVHISDSTYETKTYCINRRVESWIDTFYSYTPKGVDDSIKYILEIVEFLDNAGTIHYQRFYPNGQIMADYNYNKSSHLEQELEETNRLSASNGLDGKSTFWYPSGQLKWEKYYEHKRYGYSHLLEKKIYHENGQLKSISYPRSEGENVWKTFYSNGKPETIINYEENQKHGESIKYNENGILIEKLNYKNNKLHGKQFYYDNEGQLIKMEVYENGRLIKD